MELTDTHHPSIIKELLYQDNLPLSDLPAVMAEAMELFHVERITPGYVQTDKKNLASVWTKLLFQPFSDHRPYSAPSTAYFIGEGGLPYPIWKKILDQEEEKLSWKIEKEVDVTMFGAVGDGKTDNTKAFRRAIGKGNVRVVIPAGTFIVREIKLPDWTILAGGGKGKTILKLHDKAPKRTRLVTNRSHRKGNHHLKVTDLTLDWNAERLTQTEKTSSGNNFSSCLTYANVTCGWVKRVEAINPGLHCFDISSPVYTYAGDGTWSKGPSRYIWFDELNGSGFGDDGITTHHSSDILISNSYMSDPSGRAHKTGFSNSNGFEIDDGSRGVWLVNNASARCFGGVEIKAHRTASAASSTFIIGHLSFHDCRAFNFRHIGHHHRKDTESKTAFDIMAVNLKAVEPVRTDLYKSISPRALVVSAYKNVIIHTFTAVGDPAYDYRGEPAIAVQYRARNVFLHHFTIEGFKTASTDIQITGGSQRADLVSVKDVISENSALVAVKIGNNVENCKIVNVNGTVKR